jgi:hypothetical protein
VSRDEFIEYFEWDRAAAAAAAAGTEPFTPTASSRNTSAASSPATTPGTSPPTTPGTTPRGQRPVGFLASHLVSVKNLEKVFDIVDIEQTGRMKLRTFMKALGQVPKIGGLLDKGAQVREEDGEGAQHLMGAVFAHLETDRKREVSRDEFVEYFQWEH